MYRQATLFHALHCVIVIRMLFCCTQEAWSGDTQIQSCQIPMHTQAKMKPSVPVILVLKLTVCIVCSLPPSSKVVLLVDRWGC